MMREIKLIVSISLALLAFVKLCESASCSIDNLIGNTFQTILHDSYANSYCFKIQLFEGGIAAIDDNDPICHNDTTVDGLESLSEFQRKDGNKAFFRGGDKGWTGEFDLLDGDTGTEIEDKIKVVFFDNVTKTFLVQLKISSCSYADKLPFNQQYHLHRSYNATLDLPQQKLPSIVNLENKMSLSSDSSCAVEMFIGQTLYVSMIGISDICFKAELYNGGTFTADFNNNTYTESYTYAHFDRVDGSNILFHAKEKSEWSGIIQIKKSQYN